MIEQNDPAPEPTKFSRRVQITDHDTAFSISPQRAVDEPMRLTRKVVEESRPISVEEFEAGMGLLLDRIAELCDAKGKNMEAAVRNGSAAGLKDVLDDKEQTKKFWKSGFDELSEHTSNGASQWVGKRLLTWLIVGAITILATWLLRNNR